MKESKYNFFVPYKERVICFNALSGKVFSVNRDEYAAIQSAIGQSNRNSELSSFLYKYNFLVEDVVDEKELLKLKNHISVFDNTYHLVINPTLECNFRCWYCYDKNIMGHMKSEVVDNIKKFIQNLVDKRVIKGLILSWFGGEPLLLFEQIVYPISQFAKEVMEENNLTFSNAITTNGYLIDDSMIQKFISVNLNHFQITLDGNRESHNKVRNQNGKPSFDIIVHNITRLCEHIPEAKVILRINYTDEIIKQNFENILGMFPLKVRNHISVDFERVWQTDCEIVDRGKDNKNLIKNIDVVRSMCYTPILTKGYSVGKHHQCYVDRYYYAHINYDGKVFKCTARDYSDKYVCGELTSAGDINWRPGILERMHVKANFDNEVCLGCKLLPICIGPCYQNYLDYLRGERKEFCILGHKEIEVDTFIQEYYLMVKNSHENEK